VLLLGGSENLTLLGAGYRGANNSGPNPVTIAPGVRNEVEIEISPIPLQWDGSNIAGGTNDFTFATTLTTPGITAAPAPDRYITVGAPTALPASGDTLDVVFNLLKLEPLIKAETVNAVENLTLYEHKVRLLPRYTKYPFTPAVFAITTTAGVTGSSPGPYVIDTATTTTLTFTNDTSGTNELPEKNIDGLLQFELAYRSFGILADINGKDTTKWIIRNGLERSEDAVDTSGGYIVVKIGGGSPVDVVVPTP
jgi:hypothetical protein